MKSARFLAGLLSLVWFVSARAALVTPPTVDWISIPSSATAGSFVSIGVAAHANYSDNSDGNDWNAGYMPNILAVNVWVMRPGESGWTQIHGWIDPWRSPAEIWTGFTPTAGGTHYVRIQVMDGRPWFSDEYVYSIGVPTPAPTITSQLTMNVNQGFNTSYQITATNNPTSFTASNLPAGLSLNPSTGVISGRITQWTTTVQSTISATNSAGTDTKTLTWNITGAVITPSSSVSPTTTSVGVPVTLTRAGSANFGIGWISSTIWRPDGVAEVLGDQQPGSQSYTPTQTGTYWWQVRIVDTSAYNYVDQWISFTATGLSAPGGFQTTSVLSHSVGLSWSAVAGASVYHIYRNGAYIGSTTATSFTVTDLNPSTTYSFTVQAQDSGNNYSPHSGTATVTTAASFVVFTPLN